MLQQTTVATVRPRYAEFLRRFPSLPALARASEEEVLAAWSGLGYYARARNLHRAAREVARRHGGRLPRGIEALRELPGFGRYTAPAVAALAFGAREPAADANVTRVLSRLEAIEGRAGSRRHTEAVEASTRALLARGRPSDVTAALMDLGQLVCTPRRPLCDRCPLAALCAARRRGDPARFPQRKARPAVSRVFVAAACAVRGEAALLVRGDAPLLGGLWRFPSAEGRTPAAAARRLRTALVALGLEVQRGVPPARARHTMVHRRLEIAVYPARPADGIPKPETRNSKTVRWFSAARLERGAIPTLTRRIGLAAGFLPR